MRMWTWGFVGAAVVVGALASAPSARAEECGNIGETGVCQDPKTLVYCARGELETMVCAADEICVPHEFFGGSSGCVATRYAGCGDISEAGQCVGGALLLYCDNNRVAERLCSDGLTCGLVEEGDGAGYYDCVVASFGTSGGDAEVEPPVPPVESDVEDEDDVAEADPTYPDVIAGPSVERGGARAASEYSAGGDGACAGGGLGLEGLLIMASALAAGLRRRG